MSNKRNAGNAYDRRRRQHDDTFVLPPSSSPPPPPAFLVTEPNGEFLFHRWMCGECARHFVLPKLASQTSARLLSSSLPDSILRKLGDQASFVASSSQLPPEWFLRAIFDKIKSTNGSRLVMALTYREYIDKYVDVDIFDFDVTGIRPWFIHTGFILPNRSRRHFDSFPELHSRQPIFCEVIARDSNATETYFNDKLFRKRDDYFVLPYTSVCYHRNDSAVVGSNNEFTNVHRHAIVVFRDRRVYDSQFVGKSRKTTLVSLCRRQRSGYSVPEFKKLGDKKIFLSEIINIDNFLDAVEHVATATVE